MELELVLHQDYLEVIIKNTSSENLDFWELSNSWGFGSISFQVKTVDDASIFAIVGGGRGGDFTINFPSTFTVAPGKQREFKFDLNDGGWSRDHRIRDLKHKTTVLVRAKYHVDAPKRDEFTDNNGLKPMLDNLFTGTVVSDWITSELPHAWLFAEMPPHWAKTAEKLPGLTSDEALSSILSLMSDMTKMIKFDAKAIADESISLKATKYRADRNIGHIINGILECVEELQMAIKEIPNYLEGKEPPES